MDAVMTATTTIITMIAGCTKKMILVVAVVDIVAGSGNVGGSVVEEYMYVTIALTSWQKYPSRISVYPNPNRMYWNSHRAKSKVATGMYPGWPRFINWLSKP